jgi:16S rRNA G966 N2-methylase RsmD
MRATHINADMSHQNSGMYQLGEFFNSLKENGLFSTIKKIGQRLNYKLKGVDFTTQNIYDLTRTGEYTDHGTALVSTSKDFLKKLISDLEDTIDKGVNKEVFIDYGSGKGAAIIHAKKLGFRQTIGVEFAKELNDIAVKNIEKMNLLNVESIYADATTYQVPNNVSVIYFFNPFDKVVMEKVIDNLLQQKENFLNDVYIIYANASCTVLDEKLKLLKHINYKSGATADFYKI